MKFFSMKKPAIRILLLVVLLGLAIFYFRYMREGFEDIALDALALASARPTLTFAGTDTPTVDVASDSPTVDVASTATGSTATTTTTKGTSCTTVGSTTTIKGTTMYCCKDKSGASKWSSTAC